MSASQTALRRRARRRKGPNSPANKRRGGRRRVVSIVGGALLFLLFAGAAFGGGVGLYAMDRYDSIAEGVVPPEELIAKYSRGGARIYDRNGQLLYEFVDEVGGLRRPVALEEISQWMTQATISTEDASFYENNGLNMRGLMRAGVENFLPFGDEGFFEGSGGSSITQQLAKNVYIPLEQRADRSVDRKIRETVIALELTEKYSKEQILEWYLNSISYGGIYMGVQAASQGYFGKDASDLTLPEAALLAGIPQSPSLYAPLQGAGLDATATGSLSPTSPTKLRQLQVLDLMVRHGAITQEQANEAGAEEIVFKTNRFEIEAPHFVLNRVADEITARFGERALFDQGLEVFTTIDLDLNHTASEILEEHIVEYGVPANLHNSALIAIDPNSGQIVTWVGSRDYFNEDIEGKNDNVTALNSPGSTLKPFTFMTAFMQGWGTGTAIIDAPLTITDPASGQAFTPRNPIAGYQGPMTAALALGNSLNVTAVKAILYGGVDRTIGVLNQMGYTTLDNPGGYGPALTLGGVDITLLDQAIGYSVLAGNGMMRGQEAVVTNGDPGERTLEPIALLRVEDSDGKILLDNSLPVERRVVPAEFPYLVTSILSNGDNQCLTYGVCNALALPNGFPSAAKTGTSEPYEDSREIGETWTMGYTPNLVAGVWSGNSDNSRITNISSATLSLRAWKAFMVAAQEHLGQEPQAFERPPGVVEREVCWPSGRLPSEACPNFKRYTSLFAESVLPTNEDERSRLVDSWWQEVQIDTRTGLLAADNTPSRFVDEQVRLVFPEAEMKAWGSGLVDWAVRNGAAQYIAPTRTTDDGPLLVEITSPDENDRIRGDVDIRGRANSEDFESYSVQWGRGFDPSSWVTVHSSNRGVNNGTLGTWDTTRVPDGNYTVRVTMEDEERGTTFFRIPVRVDNAGGGDNEDDDDNGGGGDASDEAPFAMISSPLNGTVVSGRLNVTGVAYSGDLLATVVEVGQGLSPGEWTEINRRDDNMNAGTLATWDTTRFENGTYTLRVVVRDEAEGFADAQVVVVVQN
ncbi:MAG: hypothetical protein GEU80_10795 [Dehalococcoidia bacterium]|nr:hypothetical protein [Dehalococcoidia bacterium]